MPIGKNSIKRVANNGYSNVKTAAPKAEPKVKEAVISNVAPETVEAVIGHKEDAKYEKVKIGDDLPIFLM